MNRFVKWGALLALAGGGIALSGCAEEREAINRVQPNAIEKSFFVGEDLVDTQDDPEFWAQGTLADVGYGASQDGLFASTYAQPMSRIKWQITEGYLLGRIAYERIEDSDGKGLGGPVQDGVIAYAYPIKSHFDIQQDYNPTTGELINSYSENITDRPWYERTSFRVDWSRNTATDSYDFDTLSLLGVYGGIEYEPLAYEVNDPSSPDAPYFDTETGYFDVTNKAFAKPKEVDLSHLGWGIDSFPACFLDNDFMGGSAPAGSCNPVELTIRQSFRRVVDTDFEMQDWDGYRFMAYGAFYSERTGYARNYGMVDSKWRRYINRYDIWERSHYYADPAKMTGWVSCNDEELVFAADPSADADGNGTEDACEAVTEATGFGGSKCDVFKQRCTLPFRARTPVTMAWYYTTGSDPTYYLPSREAGQDWDVALRMSVMTAKYAECKHAGDESCAETYPVHFGQQTKNENSVLLATEVDDCLEGMGHTNLNGDPTACRALADSLGAQRGYGPGIIATAKMDEMLVMCHSPVEAGDPVGCAPADKRLPAGISATDCVDAWQDRDTDLYKACSSARSVRMGDLRYHTVNGVRTPATPSPWGIMVSAIDPLTGQVISTSANVWTWVNEFWSQRVVDRARYIHGELTTEEITDGEYIKDWALAAEAAGRVGVVPPMASSEIFDRMSDFAGQQVGHEHAGERIEISPEVLHKARELRRQVQISVHASIEATSTQSVKAMARARHAQGTEVEAELFTPMVQQMTGADSMPMSSTLLEYTSPLRGGHPAVERDLYRLKESALAERGACILQEAPAPVSITGLADVLQEKFGAFNPSDDDATQQARAEKMRLYIAQRVHYAVMVHEMGHSIGLRHNFVSSSDSFNYRPQYWQLRTKNGSVTDVCTEYSRNGEDCVGPRYFDAMTDNEQENLIWMFMHSSVMDYAGETTQDFLGLGAYDFAATRMFYGESVAVFADQKFDAGQPRAKGMLQKLDNFGGILGFTWTDETRPENQRDIHYSSLNNAYGLIQNCQTYSEEEVQMFKPDSWDVALNGEWHPLIDGRIVKIDGTYSKCEQAPVDYASWDDLRFPTVGADAEVGSSYYRGGPAVTDTGKIRVPYGFATDGWADLGNLSVYRHDNGADPYELFNFFIANQEVNHIFDSYRRGRMSFSVRSAAGRALHRYNEKMRDGAKGLGLMTNIYRDFSLELGYNFNTLWPSLASDIFHDNILASGMAFDHFTRELARPESGRHYFVDGDPVLRSQNDGVSVGDEDTDVTEVIIPDGATGFYDAVGIGGRLVENRLADDRGEFDSRYTMNAGSYYNKMYTSYLMTESVDNFISDSRRDFTDARYRAVSMADLFPEGYRRWLGNNLTGDDQLKGPRLEARNGVILRDAEMYPETPIGWTTWWGSEPKVCFPNDGSMVCSVYGEANSDPLHARAPQDTVTLDPQVGWEQQKFLIANTLMYLPENQKEMWLNTMRVWELGRDADPVFENRIEFHNPNGRVYVAQTMGTEVIFGQTVQKGVAARVLEYANQLMADAYVVEGVDRNGDGEPNWYIPVMDPNTGEAVVKWDPTVFAITADGMVSPNGAPGCDAVSNHACTCEASRSCLELRDYVSVPAFMRQAMDAFGLASPEARGIY